MSNRPETPVLSSPDVENRLARAAHQARPDDAHQQARQHAETHLFAQNAGVDDRIRPHEFPASACRREYDVRNAAEHRARLVAQLAGQGVPKTTVGTPTVELLRRFGAMTGFPGIPWLLAQVEGQVDQDAAELATVEARIQFQVDGYGAGRSTQPEFYAACRPLAERQVILESRLANRRGALGGFKATFPGQIQAAVGDGVDALITGVAESFALSGRLPDPPPELAAADAELARIDARLDQLGIFSGVRPGPIFSALQALRENVLAKGERLRNEHVADLESKIRGTVERALAGDVEAWAEIASAVEEHPDAFPADLGRRWRDAGIEAMAAGNATTWSQLLEASVQGGRGREG